LFVTIVAVNQAVFYNFAAPIRATTRYISEVNYSG